MAAGRARPARRIINGVAGSIGAAIPFAIAARLAEPTAPVIAVMGDGTFGFHMAEFDTAVRYSLPFVAVVGNDATWNAEYQIQLREYGAGRTHGCELLPTRYDLVAAALGGHGELVTHAQRAGTGAGARDRQRQARLRQRDDRARACPDPAPERLSHAHSDTDDLAKSRLAKCRLAESAKISNTPPNGRQKPANKKSRRRRTCCVACRCPWRRLPPWSSRRPPHTRKPPSAAASSTSPSSRKPRATTATPRRRLRCCIR